MAGRTPEAKRRLIIGSAIALIAVLLVVVLPGYIASRPAFFERYPTLAEKYEPWSTSTHVSAGCEGCHVQPGALTQTAYRAGMVGQFYLSLVSRSSAPKVFTKPTNEACLSCHYDLRSVSPKGDLLIPHKAHVNILKMKCVDCHNFLVHEKSPEGKHTPPMAGCLKCHDGDTAKNSCTACHTDKAPPETHKAPDWQIVHAEKANDECNECHKWTEKWCADCHAKRPQSHTRDWREKHGAQVKTHRSCEACHTGPFCEKCHGEVPKVNLNPALKVVQ